MSQKDDVKQLFYEINSIQYNLIKYRLPVNYQVKCGLSGGRLLDDELFLVKYEFMDRRLLYLEEILSNGSITSEEAEKICLYWGRQIREFKFFIPHIGREVEFLELSDQDLYSWGDSAKEYYRFPFRLDEQNVFERGPKNEGMNAEMLELSQFEESMYEHFPKLQGLYLSEIELLARVIIIGRELINK